MCVCSAEASSERQLGVIAAEWKDAQHPSAALGCARHHGGTAGAEGLAGCLRPRISAVPGGDVSVKGTPRGSERHREGSEGTVVKRLSFDR